MASRPSGFADELLDWHPEKMTSYRCDTGMAFLLSECACACVKWKGGRTPCHKGGTCLLWFQAHSGCHFGIGLSPLEIWALNRNLEDILGRPGWVLHWTGKLQH